MRFQLVLIYGQIGNLFNSLKILTLRKSPSNQNMDIKPGPLLSEINDSNDLRLLKPDQLKQVCEELRQYIIDIVSVNGGHFGA
ncbi:MAG: 1-deoxy-D-xylulose-5-phosphate synthase N-terminal domain-containing protein, partial [Bacteroidota bacterium]